MTPRVSKADRETDPAVDDGLEALRDFWSSAGSASSIYLRPLGPTSVMDGGGRRLAGGPLAFDRIEIVMRAGDRRARAVTGLAALERWAARTDLSGPVTDALRDLMEPRSVMAGVPLSTPVVMGIVNVTPDSFSDGGDHFGTDRAIAHGRALRRAGAAILDVGGESTRPGADPVPVDEELRRVLPVVRALAADGAVVSIDTRRAVVMRAALEAGARILNDVTALSGDPDSLAVAAASGAPVVLMHMRGEPRTMQADPRYADPALDVYDFLAGRVAACVAAGIPRARLAVDPGIGFGKSVAHNIDILRRLALFHGLGCALLVGASRKRFIGVLGGADDPRQRLGGSLAVGLDAVGQGAQILRVHDVAETVQALSLWRALHPAPDDDPIPS
ncbi:MAG: dihydropteroate synthase [Inquilinaceae bacterium]